ncbi:2,3-bisphosphoglycerate-independent phosphoglycerate mutase [Patescibacteria group bacterium]|nr:2,3-bisphosphoglycerate-independent phosphoglycerate mutase [Patescibacteria group bacterium]MBU1952459.1 2,3-bisphosphoglycerate-independent phosphoglycerate mutase [Patescibacteria group bacterium]
MPKIKEIIKSPTVLIVLDGWGIAPPSKSNAIDLAKTPVMNRLWRQYPHTQLKSFGRHVGLPAKQNGNSEAGHMNIGAGRIVDQDSVIITKSIQDGTFYRNPGFLEAVQHINKYKSNLHLMGIISGDQCPHMSPSHLIALLEFARRKKVKNVYLHFFTDGRDSNRYYAIRLVKKIEKKLNSNEKISTIIGRYYLDRTKNWNITQRAYNALVLGEGLKVENPQKAILQAYNRGETDEFVTPSVLKGGKQISDGDSVIFYNLRSDRARQLTKPFIQSKFNSKNPKGFTRRKIVKNLIFVAMTDFGPDLEGVLTAYPSIDIKDTLPMALRNVRQLYIAEGQKYAHMTYFFNGGYSDPVGGEDRITIPSISVKHFEEKPEMNAGKITSVVLQKLRAKKYDFIALNYANPDMVGHTGNIGAAIKGIEFTDKCIGRIIREVHKRKGTVIITADHGNAEDMVNLKTGEVGTQHSSNPVPFIIVSSDKRILKKKNLPEGVLGNVAPTILDIMKLDKPGKMKLKSLLQ